MANNLILYYSRKGENYCNGSIKNLAKGASFGRGIAIHGADAAESEDKVASWAKQEAE